MLYINSLIFLLRLISLVSIILLLLCLESKSWLFNIYNKIKVTALTKPLMAIPITGKLADCRRGAFCSCEAPTDNPPVSTEAVATKRTTRAIINIFKPLLEGCGE